MADTIGDRLALAHSLYSGTPELSLRGVDALCDPPLGLGHCAQIAADKIKDPGTDTLRRIATVLGCSVGWLANGEGKAPRKSAVTAAVIEARARTEQKTAKEEGR